MKRILLPILSLTVGLALTASANQIQVGYAGSSYGPYQTGSGGEFTFNDLNPDGWLDLSGYAPTTKNFGPSGISSFQTFCIERNENLDGYSAIYNATINTGAVQGGLGGGNPDLVSKGTGWLYSQFARGVLAGYNYGASRTTTAGQLQNAIWWLEDESISYSASNPFMLAVYNHFGMSEAAAKADGGWLYGVYAVNLSNSARPNAQDGLYYRPVPEVGLTAALLGLGLVGLDGFRRRFKA